jgi:V8-like Glu-specific endopeptidase
LRVERARNALPSRRFKSINSVTIFDVRLADVVRFHAVRGESAMRRLFRILIGCAIGAIGVTGFHGREAASAQAQAALTAVTSRDTAVTARVAAAEWTVSQMQAAQPLPVRALDGASAAARALSVQPRASGRAGFINSTTGGGNPGPALLVRPKTLVGGGGGYDYPAPYTRYENFPRTQAHYKEFPYRTVGRLFFTIPGQGDFVCSAASIGNYAVWTAGHCVHGGGPGQVWATNFVFVPAWYDGRMPYGQFTGAYAISNSAWVDAGDLSRDWGAVILNKNTTSNTRKVSQRVGALGFSWNQPVNASASHWATIGYPAIAPFNGQRQQICQASYAYEDTFLLFLFGPPPIGVGCDQTGGTSGGPWVRQYGPDAGTFNFLNGNQSYRLIVDGVLRTQELFSPYFDQAVKDVGYNCAVNSSPAVFDCVAPAQP